MITFLSEKYAARTLQPTFNVVKIDSDIFLEKKHGQIKYFTTTYFFLLHI